MTGSPERESQLPKATQEAETVTRGSQSSSWPFLPSRIISTYKCRARISILTEHKLYFSFIEYQRCAVHYGKCFQHVCCVCVRALSHVWPFATLWTVAHQTPLSMGFSRQEYWSGLPFPSPGDLPNPEMEPASPVSPALAGGFFTAEPPGSP